tara:strand:+ start:193 stop:396 length:204 start_codon:yes stop_codon:yes gene_type:complete
MEGRKISVKNSSELEDLRKEVEILRKQNEELKRALLGSLNARIYSLLGICGFEKELAAEGENECASE